MCAEFSAVILWYLFLVALGWGTFPLAYTCFRHFPDRGFALAKTQGIFLLSYLIWIFTSSGITLYHRSSLIRMLCLYLIMNGILLAFQINGILVWMKTHLKRLLLIEGIFLLVFLGCIVIRMYNPDLTGAEKEADFTFLNAILHSKTFPPKDTWFAGAPINYYYFGYLIWATMIKLTGIIAPVGFNLALATIVALSAAGIFGLVDHFTHRVSYSLISSLFLCILGNLDGLAQVLQRRGQAFPFDWWRSSRVIPDTINEFPYFSFLLGDLHAHFMAIPFAVLLLGLLSQFMEAFRKTGATLYVWILLTLISLSLGGASVINGWDYPTYLIIVGLGVGIAGLNAPASTQQVESKMRRILIAVLMIGVLVILSRGFFWPFYHYFTPQLSFSNIRLVASTQRTDIGYFLIIYGLFLWIILFFIYSRFHWLFTSSSDEREKNVKLVWWNSIFLVSVLGYLFFNTWVLPISCIISAVFLSLSYKEVLFLSPSPNPLRQALRQAQDTTQDRLSHQGRGDKESLSTNHQSPITNHQSPITNHQSPIPYLLLFTAYAITAGCEMMYIKDFYGHPLERQNTIFKFYYQAWILLSIGTPYLLYRISAIKREGHWKLTFFWKVIFTGLCGACCFYPIFGTYEKTSYFRGRAQGGAPYIPTLNGISYIAYREPDEYKALLWIQENIAEDAVILEATGKPYSFFGRVATTTGRSTILGWGNHEALWRDQTWKSVMQRTEEIKQIYEAVDKQNILWLVQKYKIQYIYIGRLEKETYSPEGLAAFENYFPLVFENRSVKIYQIS